MYRPKQRQTLCVLIRSYSLACFFIAKEQFSFDSLCEPKPTELSLAISKNGMRHQIELDPIVEHQSRSGKKGRKLSGIFQSRVNSMGNLSLAINFSHCCSKDWVKAQKAISFYLFNLFPFFWHTPINSYSTFFLIYKAIFAKLSILLLFLKNFNMYITTYTRPLTSKKKHLL